MKIVSLRADNFARLKAVEIRPDGALVPITGKNSAGKSSVLRAIWAALVGRAAAPPRPIHEGAERAVINLDLGSLAVTRTFARGKHGELTSSLAVENADGSRVHKTPQAMIDALLGDLSFDPLAFAKLPSKEQFDRLKRLVPGVDFEALAQTRLDAFNARTDVNRAAREATARANGIKLPPGKEPEAIDAAAALAAYEAANQRNRRREADMHGIIGDRREADRRLNEAEELRARADCLEREAGEIKARADAAEAKLPLPTDVTVLQGRLASAQEVDQVRRLHQARREHLRIAEEAGERAAKLTAAIDDIDVKVRDAVAAAKLPAGLALDAAEGVVLLNGLPFASAGTAEKITASAHAAMALNPTLRVMLIDEGSELDAAHLAMLGELAEANDFQVWLASVAEGGGGPGFHIVDGTSGSEK